jgi:hypothetical protein
VYAGGRRLRRARCATRRHVKASAADGTWSHRLRTRLRRGRYRLTARVRGPDGPRARDRVAFRVR